MNKKIVFPVTALLFCIFSLFAQENTTNSVADLLGGRIAGVITMQGNGEPGKNLAEFWVRSIGKFCANSNPLIIIDGSVVSSEDLARLSPEDIKSFSILKNKTAIELYGTSGANGVILIVTKSGSKPELKNENLPDADPNVATMKSSVEPEKSAPILWINRFGTIGVDPSAVVLIDGLEGDISSIVAADVKGFAVLRGASATAVYGERGANGVVLITTKKGQEDKLMSIAKRDIAVDTPVEFDIVQDNVEPDVDLTETENHSPELKIYPNPFFGTLHIAGAEGSTLRVITGNGVVVHTQKITSPDEIILLEHLRIGVYFFHVGDDDKRLRIVKGVKIN